MRNSANEIDRQVAGLLYHHIGPLRPDSNRSLTISPSQFEKQIRWLAWRGYVGITPSDWLRWHREGTGLPKKPILITFDDAYAETAEFALPIVRRYGFSATVFVVTNCIGGTNTWDKAEGSSPRPLMTSEQIRHWATQGIEFGAHTQTHPDLTKLSATKCLAEVLGSKDDLSALLGSAVVSFAYPYGSYDRKVRDSLEGIFPIALTCKEGMNDAGTDLLEIRRTMVQPGDTLLDIEFRAAFGRSPLATLRAQLKLRSRIRHLFGNAKLSPGR